MLLLWFFAIQLTLLVTYIILLTLGTHPHLAFLTIITVSPNSILGALFDPETCYKTKTILDDGTVVRVKRPFIGLKSHEDLVGLTGGYEVRVDGWRYEKALIRIQCCSKLLVIFMVPMAMRGCGYCGILGPQSS